MTRRGSVVLVAVISLLCPSVAYAGSAGSHPDPNDTSGPLDIKVVDVLLFRGVNGVTVIVDVRTYARWPLSVISGGLPGGGFTFDFDSTGPASLDYYAVIRAADGKPYVEVHGRGGGTLGSGGCTKTPRGIACSFPRSWLSVTRLVRWKANALAGVNLDSAPDRGWFDGWHF